MDKDKIYRETIINHPSGDCTLGEIQKDVTAWNNLSKESKTFFGFTSNTVQALIDKIISLQLELNNKEYPTLDECIRYWKS